MDLANYVRKGIGQAMQAVAGLKGQVDLLAQQVEELKERPKSITEEIDAIEGRRLYYGLVGVKDFTAGDDGRRGEFIPLPVSQDGPFIQTHYPIVMWKPIEPENTPLLGCWRPVFTWPLPYQAVSAGIIDLNLDLISISYEIQDSGSQRNFQNEPRPPDFSIPGNLVPLPVPTLFSPNTTVQFYPTYERILFNSAENPPTKGQLKVELPGYRIVNM